MGALRLDEAEESKLRVVHSELNAQEQGFVRLIATIIVDCTLNELYAERDTLPAV